MTAASQLLITCAAFPMPPAKIVSITRAAIRITTTVITTLRARDIPFICDIIY
jgi:hypothetical protein